MPYKNREDTLAAARRYYKRKMSDPIRAAKERQQRKKGLDRWRGDLRKQMVCSARYRAKKMGLPFDLTKEDIFVPDHCPVFPDIKISLGVGWSCPHSATLDRLDCTKGYVKGNVFVISWKANRLKSDATLGDLRAIVAYMEREGEINERNDAAMV